MQRLKFALLLLSVVSGWPIPGQTNEASIRHPSCRVIEWFAESLPAKNVSFGEAMIKGALEEIIEDGACNTNLDQRYGMSGTRRDAYGFCIRYGADLSRQAIGMDNLHASQEIVADVCSPFGRSTSIANDFRILGEDLNRAINRIGDRDFSQYQRTHDTWRNLGSNLEVTELWKTARPLDSQSVAFARRVHIGVTAPSRMFEGDLLVPVPSKDGLKLYLLRNADTSRGLPARVWVTLLSSSGEPLVHGGFIELGTEDDRRNHFTSTVHPHYPHHVLAFELDKLPEATSHPKNAAEFRHAQVDSAEYLLIRFALKSGDETIVFRVTPEPKPPIRSAVVR